MLYQLSYTPTKSSRFISYKKIEIKYFFQLLANIAFVAFKLARKFLIQGKKNLFS